jgi:hypothetical protein
MRARGVSIAPARHELFYKEVGEAAGRVVVRQMCPPDIGISDAVSFNGELIYRHFRNVFELKRPGQHLGLAGIRQRCSRRRFQPLRSRPVNRLNPPRCLLEPAAVSRRTRSVMIEQKASAAALAFPRHASLLSGTFLSLATPLLLPRPGGASQRDGSRPKPNESHCHCEGWSGAAIAHVCLR